MGKNDQENYRRKNKASQVILAAAVALCWAIVVFASSKNQLSVYANIPPKPQQIASPKEEQPTRHKSRRY